MNFRYISCALSLGVALSLAGPAARAATAPDSLLVLSITDMKGKIGPCGCHIPKGGLSRQASFTDSIRSEVRNVLRVDNGGFFPEIDANREFGPFIMDALRTMGVQAVGISDRDLRFGLGFLLANQRQTRLPIVCANLQEKPSGKPVFEPFRIVQVGRTKVGVFGLITDKSDLGPSRDSLQAADAIETAKRIVPQLRSRGATVVVLLSQLGKVETEDLVSVVDGVDVAIAGRRIPMIQQGRTLKNTVICYGGEEGQYMGVTAITLDGRGRKIGGHNGMTMLSPEVGEDEIHARPCEGVRGSVQRAAEVGKEGRFVNADRTLA